MATTLSTTEAPAPLFEQVDEETYRCTECGQTDCGEFESWDSFGGTTEGYERCEWCGATRAWLDLTAVI